MTISRREFMQAAGLAAVGVGTAALALRPQARAQAQGTALNIAPELHVINRLTWGARQTDVDHIREIGIAAYIEEQLNYESIADPLVDEFVGGRRILTMSYSELNSVGADMYERVLSTALWARIYRAAYSERQLYERVVEFWTDHFNIPITSLLTEKIVDDRQVVRRYAMGKFRELLFSSAQSIAMLTYLDNAYSDAEHPNENYAREVMELHTLGVTGGYTETDVRELARILTGWTIANGEFSFNPDMHDFGEKTFLGTFFPAGRGIEEGLQALDILAVHPSTAKYIAFKLARRFVSDQPPQAVVDGAAQIFLSTDGDIRAMLRYIFSTPEFMDSTSQKFRRPLDAMVAMLRVLNPAAAVENADEFLYTLEPLGHLPYFWHPPNGYPDVAGAWINTGALMERWNMGLLMGIAGSGYFPGVSLNLDAIIPQAGTVGELVDVTVERLLHHEITEQDWQQLVNYVSSNNDPMEPVGEPIRTQNYQT
jgi:hypothetical protein